MDEKFRVPSEDSPHRKFWEHLKKGGHVFRNDPRNQVRAWLHVDALNGDINNINRYGYLDLTIPPADASDYVDDGFTLTFYRRGTAFGMNVLDRWIGDNWQIAGTLPWADLQPVPGFVAGKPEMQSATLTDQKKDVLERAKDVGYRAALENRSRVPAQNEEMMKIVAEIGGPVGSSIGALKAFEQGYQQRCDEEADAVLNSP